MNWLKDRWGTQDALYGVWLASGSHVAAELAAAAGFDWALLDMEHGLGSDAEILRQLQLLSPTPTVPIVRIPDCTARAAVTRMLDAGASGIMAPGIDSADQAEAVVRLLRYPPDGTRGLTRSSRAAGYGGEFDTYFRDANARVTGIAQIETAAGVEQADAIAAVDGIDVLFIGHSDLSLDLGCADDVEAPAMRDAEARVLAACTRHNKRAGMLLKAGMSASARRGQGFSLLALGSDIGSLRQQFKDLQSRARADETDEP